MGHHQQHAHHTFERQQGKKLLGATVLNFSITIVQIVGGLASNSLSLLSDAIHNLGDSSAIFIAYVAGKISQREADAKHTFGYKRAEILAALFNAIVLMAICLFLFVEAYKRIVSPETIKGQLMLLVALFGLLANVLSVFLLHKDKHHNLNVRAAYMHLLGDTLSSVAVIAGGMAIWLWNIYWIDPLITVGVGIYIIWHTWGIVKETVDILMQSAPNGVSIEAIKTEIESMEGIDNMHHIHVWKLNDSQIHLEAHLNMDKNYTLIETMKLKTRAEQLMHEKFGISHTTLQTGFGCCKGEKHKLINTY